MSGATKVPFALLALALAGCGGAPDQNVVIANEIPADAQVEVLPPDESASTPTEELANGTANPIVNEAGPDGI